MSKVFVGRFYLHYKTGNVYRVIETGWDADSGTEKWVLYRKVLMTGQMDKFWVRTIKEFEETVAYNGEYVERFLLLEE